MHSQLFCSSYVFSRIKIVKNWLKFEIKELLPVNILPRSPRGYTQSCVLPLLISGFYSHITVTNSIAQETLLQKDDKLSRYKNKCGRLQSLTLPCL